ncbi:MAG: GntR family transcriptional regulator [Actinomycetia bacterium]|nr:GntR family transcriptional regulator [Actinomycetes bacterium]
MVQFSTARPIFQQISERIGADIMTGAYPPGSKLPSVRDLAATFGVNPNTMQRALADLEGQGLVDTYRTVGRTVTEDKATIAHAKQNLVEQRVREFIESLQGFDYSPEDLTDIIRQSIKEGGVK